MVTAKIRNESGSDWVALPVSSPRGTCVSRATSSPSGCEWCGSDAPECSLPRWVEGLGGGQYKGCFQYSGSGDDGDCYKVTCSTTWKDSFNLDNPCPYDIPEASPFFGSCDCEFDPPDIGTCYCGYIHLFEWKCV